MESVMSNPFHYVFVAYAERHKTGSRARFHFPSEYSDIVSFQMTAEELGITDWVSSWISLAKSFVILQYGLEWELDVNSVKLVRGKIEALLWVEGDDTIEFIEYGKGGI
jgi:hypothetical protein